MLLKLTALALIILGFFLIAATLWALVSAAASRSWPSTPGTIAHSLIREERTRRSRYSYAYRIRYVPEISYTYGVGDRSYKGDRISFGTPEWRSKEKAQAWIGQHLAGATVKVYYDPAEPGNCVLETNAHGAWGYALVGLVFWIFAAAIVAILPN